MNCSRFATKRPSPPLMLLRNTIFITKVVDILNRFGDELRITFARGLLIPLSLKMVFIQYNLAYKVKFYKEQFSL